VDITQHLRVIRRWHRVLVASAILGTVLAGLFLFKVSPSGVEFRRPEKWESTSTLLVTQRGFPWGRTTLPGTDGADAPPATAATDPAAAAKAGAAGTSFANPQRLSLLAIIYSFISQSNAIDQVGTPLPPGGQVTAQELSNQSSGSLPLFKLTTSAQTGAAADKLNVERTRALIKYLGDQQNANQVPSGQRVQVSVLNRPFASRIASHGAMLGAAILFLALAAGLAACYLLESLRLSRSGEQEPGTVVKPQARLRRAGASR
jgi:hypothetical protein